MKTKQFLKKQLENLCSVYCNGITKKLISYLMTVAILNLSFGCHSYFKVTPKQPNPESIETLNKSDKTIIVHYNNNKWVLKDVVLKNNTVIGKLSDYNMPPTIRPVNPDKPNRYYVSEKKSQKYLLNEAHLYINEYTDLGGNQVLIQVPSITKLEIYDEDTASTVGSLFIGILSGILSSFALCLILLNWYIASVI